MPVLVTASQLRAVLGVSVSLYSDASLESIIETAEDAIGDFLVQHKTTVYKHSCKDNIWTNYTTTPHKFYEGQSVKIQENHHNQTILTKTITEVIDPYTFTLTHTHADFDLHDVIPNDPVWATGFNLEFYDGNDAVEEAVLQIAIDVFQSRLAAGGTQQALDYTPAPYRMGRTLLYKVTGLISKYIDSNSQVG